jgi:hypothetical protein
VLVKHAIVVLSVILFAGGSHFTRAGNVLASADFINTWLVVGTFDNDGRNAGYERDYVHEGTIEPRQGLISDGKMWTYFDDHLFSRNYDDYQDLFSYFRVTHEGHDLSAYPEKRARQDGIALGQLHDG